MQYQEFLDLIFQRYSANVKLELDRMRGLLKELGQPQDALRGFHIAGTNGKGSVCATLEALCLAHGLSTGLNTSPHLIDYTERFRLRGSEMDFQRILGLFERHQPAFERWEASFFEISTAIAFLLLREEAVHTAVIEVGLGGRLDATNLFQPDVAAITTIGLDHVKTLGGTLELIAAEKAGILKPGIPVVLGRIEPGPLRVILDKARAVGAPVMQLGKDFKVRITGRSVKGLRFDYAFGRHRYKGLRSNLLGEHQAANLAVALTCFFIYMKIRGLKADPAKLRRGLTRVNWSGRMQVLSERPAIILDGAHNVQGVEALLRTLRRLWPRRRFRFLVSILADKNYAEMLRLFCSQAERIYVAQNASDRAATLEQQLAEIDKWEVPACGAEAVGAAFRQALTELGADDILICGGSLYTVGEVLQAWKQGQSILTNPKV